MAINTVSWIYGELGRALPRLTPRRNQLMSDAECRRLNSTGRKLVRLLQPKFLEEAADRLGGFHYRRWRTVAQTCMQFAESKYGTTSDAAIFGSTLGAIATDILWRVDVRVPVYAMDQVLKERIRATPSKHDLERLVCLLEKFAIPRQRRETILSEARRKLQRAHRDRVTSILTAFFDAKDGYWRRFLDRHGRPRAKKLPTIPDARRDLVAGFLQPQEFAFRVPYPRGCALTRDEVHELAAQCLKAAFPNMFPSSLDADSVKQSIRYHKIRG